MLLAALCPQAAVNPQAMKQLAVLPPPCLEFGSLNTSPSIQNFTRRLLNFMGGYDFT